jgi:response regulator RpfG family c-di-GMP phosphodiesterase
MKKNVLLIDESLTVQKVVALTLDRQRYNVQNAKSRSEAMKVILDTPPDLILVSDHVPSINASSFPGEVESWAGKDRQMPPLVLITSQDITEFGRYVSVLKKPFSPQALQAVVAQYAAVDSAAQILSDTPETESRMQKIFHESFNDEADLVRQTFQNEYESEEKTLLNIPQQNKNQQSAPLRKTPESAAELWGVADPKSHLQGGTQEEEESGIAVMNSEDSMVYKAALEGQIERFLRSQDLEAMVMKAVEKMVPPIIEKVARERIDRLLQEDGGGFVEIKP